MTIKAKTEEELKQLAQDILMEKVFTDRHLPKGNAEIFVYVFLPFAFLSKEDLEKLQKDDIGMVYEYYSKAGPRSINGYPTFSSCQMITKTEFVKVFEYYDKYKEAMAKV